MALVGWLVTGCILERSHPVRTTLPPQTHSWFFYRMIGIAAWRFPHLQESYCKSVTKYGFSDYK
jgi:hypothetical protein